MYFTATYVAVFAFLVLSLFIKLSMRSARLFVGLFAHPRNHASKLQQHSVHVVSFCGWCSGGVAMYNRFCGLCRVWHNRPVKDDASNYGIYCGYTRVQVRVWVEVNVSVSNNNNNNNYHYNVHGAIIMTKDFTRFI